MISIVVKTPRGKILNTNKESLAEKDEPKFKVQGFNSPAKASEINDNRQIDSLDWDNQLIQSTPGRRSKPIMKSQLNDNV